MYLVSNKVALNWTKITVFYTYIVHIIIYVHVINYCQNLNLQNCLAWKMKKVENTDQNVLRDFSATQNLRYLTLFFRLLCSTECRQSLFYLLN